MEYVILWNTRHSYLNHVVEAGVVFGPPVHAVLILLLVLVLVAGDLVGQVVHRDVGSVIHGDQRLLGLVPGRAGGRRAVSLTRDEEVKVVVGRVDRSGVRLSPDQGLGPPPVHVLPHLLGHRVVQILVDAGTCVVPDQSEPAKGATVHDPDGERRAVHLLLGQLHVQELDILTEVRILVCVLYDCALNIKEALHNTALERVVNKNCEKKRRNGSFYCFTANIFKQLSNKPELCDLHIPRQLSAYPPSKIALVSNLSGPRIALQI